MTPRRGQMSDDERAIWLCAMIPIFWPLLIAILLCKLGEWIRDRFWQWRHRRAARDDGRE